MLRHASLALLGLLLLAGSICADDYRLESVDKLPDGVPPKLVDAFAKTGPRIVGPEGPACSLWLVKSPTVKKDFSPSLSVKYPFAPGSLIGVLLVEQGTEMTDFREQVLKPGVYTLRYAQQPQDGNHIGTSEIADFLAVLPAQEDASPAVIDDVQKLMTLSSDASGTAHPAILALRPTEDGPAKQATLVEDADDELWILETSVGAEKPLPLRVVVVGFALE